MRLKTLAKWSVLPALIAVVWISTQAFKDVARTMQLSYTLETSTFNTVVKAADASALTTFDKINTMRYTEKTKNVATFGSDGSFSVQITHLERPTLGGKVLPLDNVNTVTIDKTGVRTNNDEPYPLEKGELESMLATAQELSAMTDNCASRATDIKALADQLVKSGAKITTKGAFTIYQVGNKETVLDLTNNVFVSEIVRENGVLVSDVYYEYNGGTSGSDSGSCAVLKRITFRNAMKSSKGIPMYNVAIYDISDVRVVPSGGK